MPEPVNVLTTFCTTLADTVPLPARLDVKSSVAVAVKLPVLEILAISYLINLSSNVTCAIKCG